MRGRDARGKCVQTVAALREDSDAPLGELTTR
jgi:hypothetical protein